MTERLHRQDGFTLIELAVAATISLLILGATMTAFIAMDGQRRRSERQNDAESLARQGSDRLARELRNLASPSDLITDAGSAQPKSVDRNLAFDIVFKDIDPGGLTAPATNPANVRRVRYCLQTSGSHGGRPVSPQRAVLWTQTQRTSASVPKLPDTPPADTSCPSAAWDTERVVADYLTNASTTPGRPLFSYSSDQGEITATDAASRERITRVTTDLFVDPDPLKQPKEAELSTGVVLRNQNRAPTASFSFEPVLVNASGCTLTFNGSASEDPENKRLTFTWFDTAGGTTTEITDGADRIVFQKLFTKGVHSFQLKVKDPAGLEATSDPQTYTCS
jgi:prepilin-type N-terminal cleavage/methylation domain-containing protein